MPFNEKKQLDKDSYVTFDLELLDAKTGQVIGKFDERKYTPDNVGKEQTEDAYKVNTNGLTDKEVMLRVKISTNTKPELSLINSKWTNDASLKKETYKEIGYQGNLAVKDYELAQNYPNPFNPTTVIKYQMPKDGHVTLKVYDILGKEVATLVDEFKTQGRYNVTFDASSLASGIYIYQIRAGNFVANKKLILMK